MTDTIAQQKRTLTMFKRLTLSAVRDDYHALRRLLRKEAKSQIRSSLRQRLSMWQRGFLSESSVIYDLTKNSPADYLSDYARFVRTPRINGNYASFLNDKLLFYEIAKNIAPVPRNFGAIIGGQFIPLEHESAGELGDDALETLARIHGSIVVKPRSGGGGSGIKIIRFDAAAGCTSNGKPGNLAVSQFKQDCVVTEFIKQAEYAKRIYPATTNTIRLLTLLEPEDHRPFVPIAIHRFGSQISGPVDNWTAGGLSSSIDLETGQLGPGVAYPNSGRIQHHHTHPDTGEKISGVIVPGWSKLRDRMLRVAESLQFLPYVGWDIIVSEDGFSIIEGNSYTDVNLLQIHQPLLRDHRVRKFYTHHRVLRP